MTKETRKRELKRELTDLHLQREVISKKIRESTTEFLEEFKNGSLIAITDHATVRHIERVLKQEVPESDLGDKDRLVKYMAANKLNYTCIDDIRAEVLTQDEQNVIARNDVRCFHKNNCRYFVKNLTLISIVPDKPR